MPNRRSHVRFPAIASTARAVGRVTPPGWGFGRVGLGCGAMTRDESALQTPPLAAATTSVLRLPGGRSESDRLAVEEPLEIRIGGRPIAVTMRTPGHDEELALGFCISEGIRPAGARLPDDLAANTVDVDAPGFDPQRLQRSFYTSSSCGVCGKGALEAVSVEAPRVTSEG